MTRSLLPLTIPSGGWSGRPRRPVTLFALLAVRDQCSHLPAFIRNVAPHVDGIVALDDGSSDGSGDYLATCPEVIELLRVRRDRPTWDEMGNFCALVAAARRHHAGWLVTLDADERVEVDFRDRAERIIRRGALLGASAYAVRCRDLWDDPGQYRIDGVWGRKRVARLFRARADHQFDSRPLHGFKVPLEARMFGLRAKVFGTFPLADLNLYHLGMLRREDRMARHRKYQMLDADCRWQPDTGYDYLVDETGLELERIPPRRDYSR